MVSGSNTKPSEENIGMFETAVMVAVVDVLCNSMSEEHNIYSLFTLLFQKSKIIVISKNMFQFFLNASKSKIRLYLYEKSRHSIL